MSIWTDFGFRASPYTTKPIPGNETGESLLVGRESELRKLKNRITSSELHPTIEGDNGVGKTSIVSVAAFQLKKMAMEGNGSQVFLPLEESFQLSTTENLEAFENKVYYAVA